MTQSRIRRGADGSLSRREFNRLVATGAAAAALGCTGDGGSGDPNVGVPAV